MSRKRLALFAVLLASCAPEEEHQSESWFVERGMERGVDFQHSTGSERRFQLPEIMGSGVGLFDYDNDGDLDLYLVQCGDLEASAEDRPPNRLFQNDGRGFFQDVTTAAGVGDRGYGMGCATGDYDADGDVDLYVTNLGSNVLYENRGDGTFRDVTAPAVAQDGWSASAGFVDFDSDGDLDLFVVEYLDWSPEIEKECLSPSGHRDYCSPKTLRAPARDALFENRGGGRFVDVTEQLGIHRSYGNGLGFVAGDFDGDRRVDFYVANDGTPNQLWLQTENGEFRESALLAGCAVDMNGMAEAGMGVLAEDFDHDGDLDLFLTHLTDESNTFYSNDAGQFVDSTMRSGLFRESLPYTGFGTGCADFDLDGHLDLYVVNGLVERDETREQRASSYGQADQLFRGLGGIRFEPIAFGDGTTSVPESTSRGAAFGDLDGDGDVDLVINDNGSRARVLINECQGRGNWIAFDVREADGTTAIGAELRLVTEQRAWRRRVSCAWGYLSAQDPRCHFGLGASKLANEVHVTWTDGEVSRYGPFEAGRSIELRRD